jgi:hypothetical protein
MGEGKDTLGKIFTERKRGWEWPEGRISGGDASLERDEESERMREEEKGLCTNRYKRQGASLTGTLLCPKAPTRVVSFRSYVARPPSSWIGYRAIVLGALLCTWDVRIDAVLRFRKCLLKGLFIKMFFLRSK